MGRAGLRRSLRQLWAAVATAVLLTGSLGSLGALVAGRQITGQAKNDGTVASPNGRIIESAPAPITMAGPDAVDKRVLEIGGQQVLVQGKWLDGVFRLSDFWIPPAP